MSLPIPPMPLPAEVARCSPCDPCFAIDPDLIHLPGLPPLFYVVIGKPNGRRPQLMSVSFDPARLRYERWLEDRGANEGRRLDDPVLNAALEAALQVLASNRSEAAKALRHTLLGFGIERDAGHLRNLAYSSRYRSGRTPLARLSCPGQRQAASALAAALVHLTRPEAALPVLVTRCTTHASLAPCAQLDTALWAPWSASPRSFSSRDGTLPLPRQSGMASGAAI